MSSNDPPQTSQRHVARAGRQRRWTGPGAADQSRTDARTDRRRRGERPEVRRHRLLPVPAAHRPQRQRRPTEEDRRPDSGVRLQRRLACRPGLARHGRRFGDEGCRGPQEIPRRRADGVPHRRRVQQAWRAQVRRDPDRFGGVRRRRMAQGPQGRTPRKSPRRSAKRPRSPPITANAWPPRARSAGPACTVGRPCSISWKKSECRRPLASRPIWPTRTCT